MSTVTKRANRCAIYTRKSSEEGLEQSFNSLDAQREACEAYSSETYLHHPAALSSHVVKTPEGGSCRQPEPVPIFGSLRAIPSRSLSLSDSQMPSIGFYWKNLGVLDHYLFEIASAFCIDICRFSAVRRAGVSI
jgi:hypothetical protein